MIVVTGAAGFIGSALIRKLNDENYKDIVLVDDFSREDKLRNYKHKIYSALVNRNDFFDWIEENHRFIQFIFHLGARTDTTEFDRSVFDRLNLSYSKYVWAACIKYGIPMVYASSAATYGLGEMGYNDDHGIIPGLQPLNPYGESKNEFDKWVLTQTAKPYFWAGLKFFNVYGPNEYHKGRMASVIWHSFNQIKETGKMKLFRSHNADYKDGEQMRDFIYVKDATEVMHFFLINRENSGIYNLGTGKARTFLDLTKSVFKNMNIPEKIEFIDTPKDIRDKYQYFTQANMDKLYSVGYERPFFTLEEGVTDYVKNYLLTDKIY
jgi:ADP-L-glycero-D-manno-heptose 6-epimerase